MKNIAWLLATISMLICGCGGSDSTSPQSGSPSSSTDGSANDPPSNNLSNSIEINPIDLGLAKGDHVCFRIKAYNNVTESKFSGAICNKIKTKQAITLAWNSVPGNVVGYYVYYGIEKNNVSNFLEDVIES